MPIKFRVPWLAVILLLIAILAACNGDSEEPTRRPTRTTVTEPAATAKPTATEPETKAEKTLNQSQGGMCICLRRGIVLGIRQQCFGP